MKTYNVIYIGEEELLLDGHGNDKLWGKAGIINDFISPWSDEVINSIEFRALWNREKLYFQFKVQDNSVHIDYTGNSFDNIGNSDRVELFFRKDKNLNPYYCLEIDPTPRVMDFRAFANRNFEFDWNFSKEDFDVKSNISENRFIVEGYITIDYLKKLELVSNNRLEVGVFRAKYYKLEPASYEPVWITWCKPESETPDFHIPSSFGTFYLT